MNYRSFVWFSSLLVAGILSYSVLSLVKDIYWGSFTDSVKTVEIRVDPGENFTGLLDRLSSTDDVPSELAFKIAAKITGLDSALRPGTYTVPANLSAIEWLKHLSAGQNSEISLTIPEGFTIAQIGERVVANFPNITKEQWEEAVGVNSPLASHPLVVLAGKPTGVDLEGYLFPDTYRFGTDATAQTIASKMIDTMALKIEALGAPTDDASSLTLHELITTASIIEREVRTSEDMKEVADIIFKRLTIGMALQFDSTVNYVTGGNDPSISHSETQLDSPYNTYKYPGLPPGPISNPGFNALQAVWHPATNDYYYFLTSADGQVYYARDYDTHLENKYRYLE